MAGRGDKPAVSVLLATYNRAKVLKRTLADMTRLREPPGGWELIVVDNNSGDDTQRVCQAFRGRLPIRTVYEPRQGKNHALNRGLVAVRGDLIILTDDDVTPCPEWLLAYSEAADRWPAYAVFGGPIECQWPRAVPELVRSRRIKWLSLGSYQRPEREGPVPPGTAFNGANMAIRRHVFDHGFRYDTAVGPIGAVRISGGETEFHLRLHRAGHEAVYVPRARVKHRVGVSDCLPGRLLKRSFGFGRGSAHLHRDALKGRYSVLGIPVWLLRQTAGDLCRLTESMLGGRLPARHSRASTLCRVHTLAFNLGRSWQLLLEAGDARLLRLARRRP